MEELLNPWTIILSGTGILLAASGGILLKYPPKKINWFYGYRTRSSMKNQDRWDFAQRYSARELIRTGFIMVLTGFAGVWISMDPVFTSFLSLPVLLVLTGVAIWRTEAALRSTFDD